MASRTVPCFLLCQLLPPPPPPPPPPLPVVVVVVVSCAAHCAPSSDPNLDVSYVLLLFHSFIIFNLSSSSFRCSSFFFSFFRPSPFEFCSSVVGGRGGGGGAMQLSHFIVPNKVHRHLALPVASSSRTNAMHTAAAAAAAVIYFPLLFLL